MEFYQYQLVMLKAQLLAACRNGDEQALLGILNRDPGINLNVAGKKGDTPLHICCIHGYSSLTSILVLSGADSTRQNVKGWLPLHFCSWFGRYHDIKSIVDNIEELSARKVLVDTQTYDGFTAIMLASSRGYNDIIKLLISYNADINTIALNGDTSLIRATYKSHIEAINLLLDANADINVGNIECKTPLMAACQRNSMEMVKCLCQRKEIQVDLQDNHGMTALIYCACGGCNDIVTFLLIKMKANPYILDHFGLSSIMHACDKDHYDIVRIMINHDVIIQKEIIDGLKELGKGDVAVEIEKDLIKHKIWKRRRNLIKVLSESYIIKNYNETIVDYEFRIKNAINDIEIDDHFKLLINVFSDKKIIENIVAFI